MERIPKLHKRIALLEVGVKRTEERIKRHNPSLIDAENIESLKDLRVRFLKRLFSNMENLQMEMEKQKSIVSYRIREAQLA